MAKNLFFLEGGFRYSHYDPAENCIPLVHLLFRTTFVCNLHTHSNQKSTMGGSWSSSAYEIDEIVSDLVHHQKEVDRKLQGLCNKIDGGAKIESGSLSTAVQALSAKVNDTADAEKNRLSADIIAHKKLHAEAVLVTAQLQELSAKVDNGLQDTFSAINKGLAIGPSVGLGVPLVVALSILFCLLYKGRRYSQYMLQSSSQILMLFLQDRIVSSSFWLANGPRNTPSLPSSYEHVTETFST